MFQADDLFATNFLWIPIATEDNQNPQNNDGALIAATATTGAVAASAVTVSIMATLIAVIVTFLVAVCCTVIVVLIWRRKVFKKIEVEQNLHTGAGTTDKTVE